MKKVILLLLWTCLIYTFTGAQSPLALPYQAVARDANGILIPNQAMSVRLSIHDGTSTGTVVYEETQSVTTNNLGLFTLSVGQGTASTGPFSSINWSTGSKWIQVEIDPTGGSTYTNMGSSQLKSVPYALYAAISGSDMQPAGQIAYGNINGTNITSDQYLFRNDTNYHTNVFSHSPGILEGLSVGGSQIFAHIPDGSFVQRYDSVENHQDLLGVGDFTPLGSPHGVGIACIRNLGTDAPVAAILLQDSDPVNTIIRFITQNPSLNHYQSQGHFDPDSASIGVYNSSISNYQTGIGMDTSTLIIHVDSVSWTWPTFDGSSGFALTTNGMGGLSWSGVPGGPAPYSRIVYGSGSGALISDSLFTRDSTLQTSIAYRYSPHVKGGYQLNEVVGILNGSANQLVNDSLGVAAVAGVADLTPVGGTSISAVVGYVNFAGGGTSLAQFDSTGANISGQNFSNLFLSRNGITFNFGGSNSYIFPTSGGGSGQVMVNDGSGNLSWSNVSGGGTSLTYSGVGYGSSSGTLISDSLFTRDSTLQTSIAYRYSPHVKGGYQLNNVVGLLNGCANQLWNDSLNAGVLAATVDLAPFGGSSLTAIVGYVSFTGASSVAQFDTSGVHISGQGNTGLSVTGSGINFSFAGGNNYNFPNTTGSSGQVMVNDGSGNLSWQNPGGGAALQTAHVTLSSSQILNLNTTPVQLIANPGPGKFIQILAVTGRLNFNTTAYSGYTTLQVITGNQMSPSIQDNILLTETNYQVDYFNFYSGPITILDGNAVNIVTPMGNPTGGDSSVDIYVTYTVISE